MVYTVSNVKVPVHKSVKVVRIVDGIHEIPDNYFANCVELKHIILPDSIQMIDSYAFDNCRKLEMITLPKDLYSIGTGCFRNCVKLKMMFLPNSLHYLHDSAFKGCSELRYINLPNKLHYVAQKVFFQCRKLEHVSLPPQVTYIRQYAFYECFSLKSITIPSSIMELDSHCFELCQSLRSVCFAERSTTEDDLWVGEYAFGMCTNLLQIDFTNCGFTYIPVKCFASCHNLRQVKLERKMNDISGNAFIHCKSLEYIGYENLPPYLCWDDDKFAMDLPSITFFGYNAFEGCSTLESIKLYRNQRFMGSTFNGCTNLRAISLPNFLPLRNHYCDLFYSCEKIELMEIRAEAKDVTYSMAFQVMYEIVKMNKNLLQKPITTDGYRPFEVLIWVLSKELKTYDKPMENRVIFRVIYEFLRGDPSMISIFECPDMYRALFQ